MTDIPEKIAILLSGIPATRKSTFGRYLAREHGFAHYDLECHPRGWPIPDLKSVWDRNRPEFIAQLRKHHDRIALDWGFPVDCLSIVEELRNQRVELIWFNGDIDSARSAFEKRGGLDVRSFDHQVAAIKKAGYPASLRCVIVEALSPGAVYLRCPEIVEQVFTSL